MGESPGLRGLTVGFTAGITVVTECVTESVTEAVFASEDDLMKKKVEIAQRSETEVEDVCFKVSRSWQNLC